MCVRMVLGGVVGIGVVLGSIGCIIWGSGQVSGLMLIIVAAGVVTALGESLAGNDAWFEDGYLTKKSAGKILEKAFCTTKWAECPEEGGHAGAVAAVRLGAEGVARQIEMVQDMVNSRALNVECEVQFTADKVREKLTAMDPVMGAINGLARQFEIKAYQVIPRMVPAWAKVDYTEDFLNRAVIKELNGMLKKKSGPEEDPKRIREVFVQAGRALRIAAVGEHLLGGAAREMRWVVTRLEQNWKDDMKAISGHISGNGGSCRERKK